MFLPRLLPGGSMDGKEIIRSTFPVKQFSQEEMLHCSLTLQGEAGGERHGSAETLDITELMSSVQSARLDGVDKIEEPIGRDNI
ncbi:hypothetical protein RRG08_057010 [Elysia crispata]|uniref:Uncharacterized protein n=1 Tax=Elysia crispata TaxID=231223 RepID=A0AAE0Z7Z1_9GAST|nr:hypothetical protein RRG08_057010 [Elysia crispata]